MTSTVIQRGEARTQEADRAQRERESQMIVDALTQTRHAVIELDQRLESIESRLTT